jgi:hypothetical protein
MEGLYIFEIIFTKFLNLDKTLKTFLLAYKMLLVAFYFNKDPGRRQSQAVFLCS